MPADVAHKNLNNIRKELAPPYKKSDRHYKPTGPVSQSVRDPQNSLVEVCLFKKHAAIMELHASF